MAAFLAAAKAMKAKNAQEEGGTSISATI